MPLPRLPVALTIAGSDSSGGAGIQADLKTFCAFGVYGASVLTALTAQNTTGVKSVHAVPPDFVAAQIAAVLDDLEVGAMKTGMLANTPIIESVVRTLDRYPRIPLIVDPVMVATSGDALLDPGAVEAVRTALFPRAALVTPNIPEAARLLNASAAETEAEMQDQLRALGELGAGAVLLKGGHSAGADAVDFLLVDGEIVRLSAPRIETHNTHGTGCTLSAAIAALVAQGVGLPQAVARAKTYVQRAIAAARDQHLGAGSGPVDHLYAQRTSPPPA